MPETQKGTLRCPECGEPISAVLQRLSGWAHFHGKDAVELTGSTVCPDALSYCDWTGDTEIIWDSQINHPDNQVMCDNGHVVQLEDCTFEPSASEPFPYVEAIVTRTLVWRSDEYLNYCRENDKTPTADDFANWVREDMEASGDFPNDGVHNFSVELKRRPAS